MRPNPYPLPLVFFLALFAVAEPCSAQDDHRADDHSPLSSLIPGINFGGFSDFSYHSGDDVVGREGFSEGQFILHVSSSLGKRIQYFSEMALTARPNHGFQPSIERTMIRFAINERLSLSTGRFHTPLTYWNTNYHHGQWLQTSADRPQVAKFGSRFIPIHFVGAKLARTQTVLGRDTQFAVGLGNGRQEDNFAAAGDGGDDDGHLASMASAVVDLSDHVQIGGAYFNDRISYLPSSFEVPEPESGARYNERIIAAHIVLTRGRSKLMVEGLMVKHVSTRTGAQWSNSGWYAQFERRLNVLDQRVTAYGRLDEITVDQTDLVFCSQALKGWRGQVAGFRFDVGPTAAVKFEARRSKQPGLPYRFDFVGQVSYAF